ncbi:hypothetical protein FOZ63_023199 [Perkinsus olseni]|uniref:Uncharacterized protein n=2 Tax=Perkinsus olseni TaxID=32597 RepID=A0A7J6REK3_PEROL|nr:hypothetical protein FOZ63_023199 [Perkinsus olseni]
MASSVPAVNGFGDSAFTFDPTATTAGAPPKEGTTTTGRVAPQSPFDTNFALTQKSSGGAASGAANVSGFGMPDGVVSAGNKNAAADAPGSERDCIYIDFDILGDGKTDPNE